MIMMIIFKNLIKENQIKLDWKNPQKHLITNVEMLFFEFHWNLGETRLKKITPKIPNIQQQQFTTDHN